VAAVPLDACEPLDRMLCSWRPPQCGEAALLVGESAGLPACGDHTAWIWPLPEAGGELVPVMICSFSSARPPLE
jgi:hypothetical protein